MDNVSIDTVLENYKKALENESKRFDDVAEIAEKALQRNETLIKMNKELLEQFEIVSTIAKNVITERYSTFENDCLPVKVKYFVDDITPIEKITNGDWIDLRAGETVDLTAGEYRLIRLGVGMILPTGYEAIIAPRSSTYKNFGIIQSNSIGVIDNSYSGDGDEWRFPAIAIVNTHIEKGDRICQFRLVKNAPKLEFNTVEHLNSISRGGIGSTGKK